MGKRVIKKCVLGKFGLGWDDIMRLVLEEGCWMG
jgi:hypothetical protein